MLRLSEPPGPGADPGHTRPASRRCGDLRRVHRYPGRPIATLAHRAHWLRCSGVGFVPRAAHHLVTSRPGQGWGWRARAPHLGHRVPPCGAAQRHRPAGLRGACADRLLRVELDVLGDADRLAEAGPRAVGEGLPWYPRSGPAGFGRGRARQAPPLSTLTGAANGRLRPASWPPVDMVLATGAWSSIWDSVAISLPGQRRTARWQRPSRRLPLPAMGNGRARPASC